MNLYEVGKVDNQLTRCKGRSYFNTSALWSHTRR